MVGVEHMSIRMNIYNARHIRNLDFRLISNSIGLVKPVRVHAEKSVYGEFFVLNTGVIIYPPHVSMKERIQPSFGGGKY